MNTLIDTLSFIAKNKLFDCLDVLSNFAFPSNEINLLKTALKAHKGYIENIADNILFYHGLNQWQAVLCNDEVKDINDVEKCVIKGIARQYNYVSALAVNHYLA
jgi:hypothetical protein